MKAEDDIGNPFNGAPTLDTLLLFGSLFIAVGVMIECKWESKLRLTTSKEDILRWDEGDVRRVKVPIDPRSTRTGTIMLPTTRLGGFEPRPFGNATVETDEDLGVVEKFGIEAAAAGNDSGTDGGVGTGRSSTLMAVMVAFLRWWIVAVVV